MGAGRTEVIRCLFGLDVYDTGRILVDGRHGLRRGRPLLLCFVRAGLARLVGGFPLCLSAAGGFRPFPVHVDDENHRKDDDQYGDHAG